MPNRECPLLIALNDTRHVMPHHVALFVSYDGTLYHGFQLQPNVKTVMGKVLECLDRVSRGRYDRVTYSGRTDVGVSALWQTIGIRLTNSPPLVELARCLSSGGGLFVWGYRDELPPEFHAARSALFRDYVYIDKGDAYRCKDWGKLSWLASSLASRRDFTFLYKDWKKPPHEAAFRRLYTIRLVALREGMLAVHVRGEGFAWNMVRRLVHFLRKAECNASFEESVKRWIPGAAEPYNLFLTGVKYPFAPRLTARAEEIIERTFASTRIGTSVLNALRDFLFRDRLVYSPFSFLW